MSIEDVVRQMPDAVVIVGADGRILLSNRVAEMQARTDAGVLGTEMSAAWPTYRASGDLYGAADWPLNRAITTGEVIVDEELFILDEAGEPQWYACSCSPIRDEDGEIVAAVSVARDITERRRHEAELAFHAGLLDNTEDAIVALDAGWHVTAWNMGAERLYGWTAAEVLGRRTLDVAFPDLGPQQRAEIRRRTAEDGRWRGQVVARCKDGSAVAVEVITVAIKADGGRVVGYLGIHRDVTEHRRAELERESRARQQEAVAELGLQALGDQDVQGLMDEACGAIARTLGVELAGVAQVVPGIDRLLLRAGVGWKAGSVGAATGAAAAGSLVGYTLELGEPVISDDVSTDGRFRLSRLLLEHTPMSAVTVVIAGRPEPFGVLGAFSQQRRPFSHGDVNFLQSVANVISIAVERGAIERTLHDVREHERARIARDLHDDALQLLTQAIGEVDRRGGDLGFNHPVSGLLRRVGEQLRAAIYDLRLSGREHRPIAELLSGLVDVQRAIAPDCAITLGMRALPAEPLGDVGTEWLRVVGEAITNARRHAGAGEIDVRAWATSRFLHGEVSDDGHGFDVEADGEGAGIGLQGMRERIALLDGHFHIRSLSRGGTTVRFRVPLPATTPRAGEVTRVLLVEDHVGVREALAAAFDREDDFDVAGQAGSLAEARDLLDGVDVAILDLTLPDGNGIDLIAELLRASPQAQAVVLSATLDRGELARAVHGGAAGAVNKAAPLSELVQAVRRLRAGETLIPAAEAAELVRYAESRRRQEHEDRAAIESLTPREREILQALAEGLGSQEIADRLVISVRTERNHMASILRKLGLHSRLQALVFALRYGIVEVS